MVDCFRRRVVGFRAIIVLHSSLLAITGRVDADILVVEGWVHRYAIRAAADEFRSGSYRRAFTTAGPVDGIGGYINDFQTSAGVGAGSFTKRGSAGRIRTDGSKQMVALQLFRPLLAGAAFGLERRQNPSVCSNWRERNAKRLMFVRAATTSRPKST